MPEYWNRRRKKFERLFLAGQKKKPKKENTVNRLIRKYIIKRNGKLIEKG